MLLQITRFSTAILLALLLGTPAQAATLSPDFSSTTIAIEPAAPVEGEVVTYTLRLRNAGADDAGWVYVAIDWPVAGFLVDAKGVDGAEIDHDARRITVQQLPLAAGGEHPVTLRILLPKESAGDALALSLRMSHFASDTNHYDRTSVSVETRSTDGGARVGGLRVTRAGLVVLGVLAGGALLWLTLLGISMARGPRSPRADGSAIVASRVGPGAAAAAITIAIGFWVYFAAMAWRDYQSLSWPESTCTILGGRLSAQSNTAGGTRPASGAPRDDTTYVPVLGLRYAVAGQDTYSSGYDTGSRLGFGGRGGSARELAQWRVGAQTPCWYSPSDPLDVVVRRGFGGAYLFALFPLPVFWIGLAGARAAVSRR